MALHEQKPAAVFSRQSSTNRIRMTSLVSLCRDIVVKNLTKYPPQAFGILDESEWEAIITLRHRTTRPQKGTGGLDGTGRMNPAVGDKFLAEVEETIPHLAHSRIVDDLVWKDVVEYRFKAGGLSRPKGLLYPWPLLESKTEDAGKVLNTLQRQDTIDDADRRAGLDAIKTLSDLPMDVTLLKSSGIGKAVKKFLKACTSNEQLQIFDEPLSNQNLRETPRTNLQAVLDSWMRMAASSGVKMKDSSGADSSAADDGEHLSMARKCRSWRELFVTLTEYENERKSTQGARMKARRQKLDSVRPKVVKVRHASSRQNAILDRQGGRRFDGGTPQKNKIQQLRQEARVTSSRRQPPLKPSAIKSSGGFGAAVAFATGQKGTKRKACATTAVNLAGRKTMRVPDSTKAGAQTKQKLLGKMKRISR